VERGDAAAGGVGTAVAPHRYVLLSPDAIFLASPADYCRHVVACYLQRVPISGADRLPQASALWEKCRVELGDAEEMPPDIPDERWIDFISLLERTGRVKKVWPEIATRRKERKNCAKLADAILDTRLTASALGLAENECPACRECDDTMKHFGGDGGKAKWKHFRGHCGDGGGPAKMAELVLGKDGAAAFLSDQVGEQTPAPPEWPQEDMSRVSDDPDEEEDDEEGAPAEPKKAWYGPAHVARAWEACRSLDELPEYRPGMRVELAGSALTWPADVRICTVNCEGVMGKGVAAAFKEAYPGLLEAYQVACRGETSTTCRVHVGQPHDVLATRPSVLGNPFSHLERSTADVYVATRDEACDAHEFWLRTGELSEACRAQFTSEALQALEAQRRDVLAHLPDLWGKRIACVCRAEERCHVDTLVRLADETHTGLVSAASVPRVEHDGVTHLNIYSQAETELGRFWSNFQYAPTRTEDGPFDSIEGLWYYLLSAPTPAREKLRTLSGYEAKQYGRTLPREDWRDTADFRRKVCAALHLKGEASPRMLAALKASTLPLDHYYVYGDAAKRPERGRWMLQCLEAMRRGTPAPVELRPGGVFRWDAPDGTVVLCAATKDAWKEPSRYTWVEACAAELRRHVDTLHAERRRLRVALPALGCQNGKLDWEGVLVRLEYAFRGCKADVVVLSPDAEKRASTVDDPVARYVDSRQLLSPEIDARAADSDTPLRLGLEPLLAQAPALVTPIRDAAGVVCNLQLRFVRPVQDKSGRTKTKFLNGGNPGATYGEDGLPFAYGEPHKLDGAELALFFEGGPDTHAGMLLAREMEDAIALGTLDAGHMVKLADLVHRCLAPPKRAMVFPHKDAVQSHQGRYYSQGHEAGEKLHGALIWGDLPAQAEVVLVGTGHRQDARIGMEESQSDRVFNALVDDAVDVVRHVQERCKIVRGVSGMALFWDQALAQAFNFLGVPWTAALPFDGQEERWSEASRARWRKILSGATEQHVVCPGPYRDGVLQARNEWMARRGTHTIALWDGSPGGTANYLRYNAESVKTPVFNAWKVWTKAYKLWEWNEALDALGLERRDGWDVADVLKMVGRERLLGEVLRQLK